MRREFASYMCEQNIKNKMFESAKVRICIKGTMQIVEQAQVQLSGSYVSDHAIFRLCQS